jgi:hypothetical protein
LKSGTFSNGADLKIQTEADELRANTIQINTTSTHSLGGRAQTNYMVKRKRRERAELMTPNSSTRL